MYVVCRQKALYLYKYISAGQQLAENAWIIFHQKVYVTCHQKSQTQELMEEEHSTKLKNCWTHITASHYN